MANGLRSMTGKGVAEFGMCSVICCFVVDKRTRSWSIVTWFLRCEVSIECGAGERLNETLTDS